MTSQSRLLIYCEGETEKQYVLSVAEALKVRNLPAVRNTSACDPMSLLAAAYKDYCWSQVADASPFTEIWLVFDRDHHASYDQVFEFAKKLEPEIHLCWTNPCIEFWFWLHYSCNPAQLKFDDVMEVACEEKTVNLGNGVSEITTVRRVQKSILPDTMLMLLKRHCPSYSKVKCPAGLVARSVAACDHLEKVAQSKNPRLLGSAMPQLLLRLAHLAEGKEPEAPPAPVSAPVPAEAPKAVEPEPVALDPTKSAPVAESEARSVTEPAPAEAAWQAVRALSVEEETAIALALRAPMEEKARQIRMATAGFSVEPPADPLADCKAPLLACLPDWPTIEVTASGVEVSADALDRMEAFFKAVAGTRTDERTRSRGRSGVETVQSFRRLVKLAPTPKRLKRQQGEMAALGQGLRHFVQALGLEKEAGATDFTLRAPEATGEAKDPEAVLQERLARLRTLEKEFRCVLQLVRCPKGEAPQELMPGFCEKAARLEALALSEVTGCLSALADAAQEAGDGE